MCGGRLRRASDPGHMSVDQGTGSQSTLHRWLVGRGTELYNLSPRTISLEDLFVRIVEGAHVVEDGEPCETS